MNQGTSNVFEAKRELLLAMADDEWVLGSRDLEWAAMAPTLEEDVALCSIGQDELGHAILLYEQAAAAGLAPGQTAEVLDAPYDRAPEAFLQCALVEPASDDFAFTICRRLVYECADQIKLDSLASAGDRQLRDIASALQAEEALHLEHAREWFALLSRAEPGRSRLRLGLERVAELCSDLFVPVTTESALLASGCLSEGWRALEVRWLRRVEAELEGSALPFPFEGGPATQRRGQRYPSADFLLLYDDMHRVRSLAPNGAW